MKTIDTPKMSPEWLRRLLIGLSWFVALEFFLFAPFKFYPDGVFGWTWPYDTCHPWKKYLLSAP